MWNRGVRYCQIAVKGVHRESAFGDLGPKTTGTQFRRRRSPFYGPIGCRINFPLEPYYSYIGVHVAGVKRRVVREWADLSDWCGIVKDRVLGVGAPTGTRRVSVFLQVFIRSSTDFSWSRVRMYALTVGRFVERDAANKKRRWRQRCRLTWT